MTRAQARRKLNEYTGKRHKFAIPLLTKLVNLTPMKDIETDNVEDFESRPLMPTLRAATKRKDRQIRAMIALLKEYGIVKVGYKKGKSEQNTYRLYLAKLRSDDRPKPRLEFSYPHKGAQRTVSLFDLVPYRAPEVSSLCMN